MAHWSNHWTVEHKRANTHTHSYWISSFNESHAAKPCKLPLGIQHTYNSLHTSVTRLKMLDFHSPSPLHWPLPEPSVQWPCCSDHAEYTIGNSQPKNENNKTFALFIWKEKGEREINTHTWIALGHASHAFSFQLLIVKLRCIKARVENKSRSFP